MNAVGTQQKSGEIPPAMDWTGDPISAIARYCQARNWLFSWDPVDPWIDLRWFAEQWGVSVQTIEKKCTVGLFRMESREKGIAYRASDMNARRARPPAETNFTKGKRKARKT